MNPSHPARNLIDFTENTLRRLDAPGRRVCVGLSGGIDSVVLLTLLSQLRTKLDLQLSAIHVHHGLSPNADQWAQFCISLCSPNAIPLATVSVNIDQSLPGGMEALARDARYAAFNDVDADFVALAQHADDQAETVLHQILRGTGLKGMAGMGETRVLRKGMRLIRPLLGISRAEIEAFARGHRLEWIEDESNAETAFTRNFIRHELTSIVEARFPHYRESLARAGRHAAESDEMLAALAAIDLKWDGTNAFADVLDTLPLSRQVNALYYWLHWQRRDDETKTAFPAQTQLSEWAAQLFRPAPTDKPHRAGGHEWVILRRKNLLQLQRK
jgi:tRNA(Ile)-lysidine synthase